MLDFRFAINDKNKCVSLCKFDQNFYLFSKIYKKYVQKFSKAMDMLITVFVELQILNSVKYYFSKLIIVEISVFYIMTITNFSAIIHFITILRTLISILARLYAKIDGCRLSICRCLSKVQNYRS